MSQDEEFGARTLKEKSKATHAFHTLPEEEVSWVAREGDLPPQLGIDPGLGEHLQAGVLGLGQEEAVLAAGRAATRPVPGGAEGPGAHAWARRQQGHLAAHRHKGWRDLASRSAGGDYQGDYQVAPRPEPG